MTLQIHSRFGLRDKLEMQQRLHRAFAYTTAILGKALRINHCMCTCVTVTNFAVAAFCHIGVRRSKHLWHIPMNAGDAWKGVSL